MTETLTLAPLPAPPAYPAVTWQAEGPRLFISAPDVLALYGYLVEIDSWSAGVMAERALYRQEKK
ncbi:MAG: hypothetical protein LBJ14_05815 [Desulfarculales bacterium]|nr:hypothetical protein [Desulfarculales bacterium]